MVVVVRTCRGGVPEIVEQLPLRANWNETPKLVRSRFAIESALRRAHVSLRVMFAKHAVELSSASSDQGGERSGLTHAVCRATRGRSAAPGVKRLDLRIRISLPCSLSCLD